MIRITIIILFISLCACSSEAQLKAISCNVLEVILKENDFKYEKAKNSSPVYKYDTLGNLTIKIFEQKKINIAKVVSSKIILIDTFGFFSPKCSGSYSRSSIEVRNTPLSLSEQKQELKNLFWVSGIGTGKDNAFCISILRQASNEIFIYSLSILGYDIKVIKKKEGVF